MLYCQILMSAVKIQMSVMTMPTVLTLWEDMIVPVILDIQEMDSPALVSVHISS